jgi:inhibitor of cysteine peptidase
MYFGGAQQTSASAFVRCVEGKLTMQTLRLRRNFYALECLFLVAFAVLVATSKTSFAASKVIITEADKGGEVHLKLGDRLELRLKSNPSTGYMWSVQPRSTPLLKLLRQSQIKAVEPGVGRPIVQIFTFEAHRRGTGVLLLRYARSWETTAPDEEQYQIHVLIE